MCQTLYTVDRHLYSVKLHAMYIRTVQFENNRIIYFKIRTAFDMTDGLDAGSGITLELFKTPAGPSLSHSDKFGTLSVVAALLAGGDKVEREKMMIIIIL
jgi:hypothetical protein